VKFQKEKEQLLAMDANVVPPTRKRGRPVLPESQSKRLKEWREERRRLTVDKEEVEVVVIAEGESEESDEENPFQ
jgi:hypothetical protein